VELAHLPHGELRRESLRQRLPIRWAGSGCCERLG